MYLIFYAEKGIQQDVLEFSLNLMGEELLAMVPVDVGREKLSELYDDFKQRAINGLIEPEQVEAVAANILNVRNTEESITPQQAEGILQSGMMAPTAIAQVEPAPTAQAKAPEHSLPERWKSTGERVKIMFAFNEQMQEAVKEHAATSTEMPRQIHYEAKDGLNLVVDTRLKTLMDEKKIMSLTKELEHLEHLELLTWQENLSEKLAKEQEKMKIELDNLQESLEELKLQHLSEKLEHLESLKSLEHLEYIPVMSADSIRKVAEKSLRDAGIHPHAPSKKSKN